MRGLAALPKRATCESCQGTRAGSEARTITSRARDGFTLLETLIVVAVLGLLLGFSVPLYRGSLADRAVWNAAFQVQNDLRLAQQVALARAGRGPRVELCFLSANHDAGYEIYTVDYTDRFARTGAVIGQTVKVVRAGEAFRTGLDVDVEAGATQACLAGGGRPALVYLSTGSPTFATERRITLTYQGRSRCVTITPTTGRATAGRCP
ncbi:MAG: GspH/FimT family pseudopilin [Armatimonadota bacterium]|nr:GspH/FimT family pseudopilin [Armatimonadota bacterium]MDR7533715.1 GspH/FimT family pseudopilin [Armatimonadota bacterium]